MFSAILHLGFRFHSKRTPHPSPALQIASEDTIKKKYLTRKQDAEDLADEREKEAIEHGATELTASERAVVLEFRDRLTECGGERPEKRLKPTVRNVRAPFVPSPWKRWFPS